MEYFKEFYSQFGEDKFVREKLFPKYEYKGYFIDVGAGHPIINSNTYHFEKNGWHGLCIDPDPKQHSELRKIRDNVMLAAAGKEDGSAKIKIHRFGELTRLSEDGEDETFIYTLDTLILINDIISKIDLMSIDVEGHEMQVLKGLSDENLPDVMIIEYKNHIDGDRSQLLYSYLSQKGYQIAKKTKSNLILKRNEKISNYIH